jgi:hypothetical protein
VEEISLPVVFFVPSDSKILSFSMKSWSMQNYVIHRLAFFLDSLVVFSLCSLNIKGLTALAETHWFFFEFAVVWICFQDQPSKCVIPAYCFIDSASFLNSSKHAPQALLLSRFRELCEQQCK